MGMARVEGHNVKVEFVDKDRELLRVSGTGVQHVHDKLKQISPSRVGISPIFDGSFIFPYNAMLQGISTDKNCLGDYINRGNSRHYVQYVVKLHAAANQSQARAI